MSRDAKPDDALDVDTRIAIIGIAMRVPGALTVDHFWTNLVAGREALEQFDDATLAAAGVDPAARRHARFVAAGFTLEGADRFDAEFFGFSPRDAEILDPQQRQFLECAWEALERAGYAAPSRRGRVGVFAGSASSSYFRNYLLPRADLAESIGSLQLVVSNEKDFVSTRTAYCLDLRGPVLTVQCACSTSLAAVHMGCQSLNDGESDLVLAGGVSIRFPQETGHEYQPGGIASPDGHCRAYDENGQGCAGAPGVAIVVLKRMADALRDGDHIHAVIRGSAHRAFPGEFCGVRQRFGPI